MAKGVDVHVTGQQMTASVGGVSVTATKKVTELDHLFTGRGFAKARVIERRAAMFTDEVAADLSNLPTAAIVETTGAGREWHATGPMAFWRTFAKDLDFADDATVEGWFARYGDPDGVLSAKSRTHTGHWFNLRNCLTSLASFWTSPDDWFGISTCTEEGELSIETTVRRLFKQENVSLDPDNRCGFVVRYKLLGDFMIGSATEHWRRKTSMRRCAVCGHFFAISRSTGIVCSATCHAKRYQDQRKERTG